MHAKDRATSDHSAVRVQADRCIDELRHAMEKQADDVSLITMARRPMGILCAAAHEQRLAPQEVLVILKRAMAQLPQRRDLDGDTLRARLVTLMIEAYFSGDP